MRGAFRQRCRNATLPRAGGTPPKAKSRLAFRRIRGICCRTDVANSQRAASPRLDRMPAFTAMIKTF
jgi:hypothetical protein